MHRYRGSLRCTISGLPIDGTSSNMRSLAVLSLVLGATGWQEERPRYALLLAGGLRTFVVTWPTMLDLVVERNGGRGSFYIGLAASYDVGKQSELAASSREVCRRSRFDACDLYPYDIRRTRAFYEGRPVAQARLSQCGAQVCSFVFQWELVSRAFRALVASHGDVEYVVRTRPDVIVFKPLDLSAYVSGACGELRECAVVPCAVDKGKAVPWTREGGLGRLVDDFVVASVDTFRTYATLWDGEDVAEDHVTKVLGSSDSVRTKSAHHAILSYADARLYLDNGQYVTTRRHARCVGIIEGPVRRGASMPTYNASDDAALSRYVAGLDQRRGRAPS